MKNQTLIITVAFLLIAVAVFFVGKYQGGKAT
jgi:hypothetical protein